MEKINVLVAEDYEFNQLVIKQLLHEAGFDSVIVNNGKEALGQLANAPFDIVFMDIEMPVMDGAEATRRIKSSENENIRKIPVIAFTAHKDEKLLNELKKSGFDDFIQKPFAKDEVVAIIEKYVLKKQGATGGATAKMAPATGGEKSYDLAKLMAFGDGDEEFVRKMLEYFVANAPNVIGSMREDYEHENWPGLKMTAHKFGSELGLLGIARMEKLSDQIEAQAERHKKTAVFAANIDEMEQYGTEVIEQIKTDFNL